MPVASVIAILLSVLLNASAMIFLKTGARQLGELSFTEGWLESIVRIALQPYIWVGVTCYGISLVIWVFVISREPVSAAYPITALVYIFNALGAAYFFGEVLRPGQWLGMAFILFGVFCIAKA